MRTRGPARVPGDRGAADWRSSLAELRRKHEGAAPAPPSSVATGIDPVVERVILHCLEKDPRARLSSALQVASDLPGGDPLAAALAAGETPSPEMVAAALFPARGQTPIGVDPLALGGLVGLVSYAGSAIAKSLVYLVMTAAMLFFGRLALRIAALAAAATWLLLFVTSSGQENPLIEMAGGAVVATVFLVVFFRGGLLGLAVVLAVAAYGLWAARGGALFSGDPVYE